MISEKHLAIVRAALTFWDEEMATASRSTYSHYLHSADSGTEFTSEDVAFVRRYFNEILLKRALIEKSTGHFNSNAPVDLDSELAYQVGRQTPVIVLFPSADSRVGD